jgi:hypothetical protein
MRIDAHCELYRVQNASMKAAYEAAAQGRTFAADWLEAEAGTTFGVADCVLPYTRCADLIIASQTDPDWPGSQHLGVANSLAIEASGQC